MEFEFLNTTRTMKFALLLYMALLSISCKNGKGEKGESKQTGDGSVEVSSVSYRRFYKISYCDIKARTVVVDERDPFHGLAKEYPERLLQRAGLVFPDGVLFRYRWEDETLIVTGPDEFHREIEKILKVKGTIPSDESKSDD